MHRPADTVVLIPIRSFDDSKSRLSGALDARERRHLTMRMAETVVAAARGLPVRIVSDDEEVLAWADAQWPREHAVGGLSVGRRGLNESVTAAVERAADVGFDRALVAHADLPAADDLTVVDRDGVCIAPDRARDGSNVLCVPTRAGFVFSYGPDSFRRHCAEAERLDLPLTVIDEPSLAWDVDDPADLPDDWSR